VSGDDPAPPARPPGPVPSDAALSLVLGLGTVLFGPLSGVPAMVLGRRAVRRIEASGDVLGGRRVATAGFVLGLVGTALSVLALLALVWVLSQGGGLSGPPDRS
jgi:tetrahydromethanopterin S-methyltransferase subunit C